MSDIMAEIQKILLELSISQKETNKQMKENNNKFSRQMKEIQKELWWIWNSQEEVWVDLFRRNMKSILAKKGIKIDNTSTRFKNRVRLEDWTFIEWEYDLMWINWKDIVVVEVKNKLKDDHINKFVKVQLPRFKLLFPQYKDYNLYGWIWSLIVWKHQEEIAEKQWLFVFTQWENWNAMIMNDDNFKAKIS